MIIYSQAGPSGALPAAAAGDNGAGAEHHDTVSFFFLYITSILICVLFLLWYFIMRKTDNDCPSIGSGWHHMRWPWEYPCGSHGPLHGKFLTNLTNINDGHIALNVYIFMICVLTFFYTISHSFINFLKRTVCHIISWILVYHFISSWERKSISQLNNNKQKFMIMEMNWF